MRMLVLLAVFALAGCRCGLTPLGGYCPLGAACFVGEDGAVETETLDAPLGACHHGTVTSCDADGIPACTGSQSPSTEKCNGLDDDCDGAVDDHLQEPDDSEFSCAQINECGPSVKRCKAGVWTCVYPNQRPETCNGLDDDCDGVADNGLDIVYTYPDNEFPGTTGIGQCKPGVTQCVHGHMTTTEPVTPVDEVCGNGLDDNCDGFVDENGMPDPRAYMLVVDASAPMDVYLPIIADAFCSIAYSEEMANALVKPVFVARSTLSPGIEQYAFEDAPTVCDRLANLATTSDTPYMYEGVDMAEDTTWPVDYPAHHVISFTNRKVFSNLYTTDLNTLRTECVGLYDLTAFADPVDMAHDWVPLVQSCGGTEEDITDTSTLRQHIIDQFASTC